MIVGPRARALIKSYEQCRLTAYLPTPNDVPTIGWGATGPDIVLGMTWTQAQCDARFTTDLPGLPQVSKRHWAMHPPCRGNSARWLAWLIISEPAPFDPRHCAASIGPATKQEPLPSLPGGIGRRTKCWPG